MAALLIFPEEVWEKIVAKLDCSRDLSNLFKAYPELAVEGSYLTMRRNLSLSLFDQIFGHVFPWLTLEEVLISRQVCRQWTVAVDNHLANHQDKRAFQHGSGTEVSDQNWTPPAHRSYYQLERYFPGMKAISNFEMYSKFLRDMAGHPAERNPFVGRSLNLNNAGGLELAREAVAWDDGVLDMFRQFGNHIWFLRVEDRYLGETAHFSHILIESLSLVPNLKSLEIVTSHDGSKIALFLRNGGMSLPVLPQLQTLKLNNSGNSWLYPSTVELFLEGYSKQLRRLDMDAGFWRANYADIFPSLTELRLQAPAGGNYLLNLLGSIDSKQLHVLEVDFTVRGCLEEFHQFLDNIFPLLTRFPRIFSATFTSSATLRLGKVKDSGSLDFSIPSLKALVIWSENGHYHEVDHRSLECFPALEYLKVKGKVKMEQMWNLLPKLKEVTVGSYYGKSVTRQRD